MLDNLPVCEEIERFAHAAHGRYLRNYRKHYTHSALTHVKNLSGKRLQKNKEAGVINLAVVSSLDDFEFR